MTHREAFTKPAVPHRSSIPQEHCNKNLAHIAFPQLRQALFTIPKVPTAASARLTRSSAFSSEENPPSDAAIIHLIHLIHLITSASALLGLALAKRLADTDRPARAQLLLERAVTDSATSYEAHISLARIHTIQARYAEALAAIDLALALRPSDNLRQYRDSCAQTLAASQ